MGPALIPIAVVLAIAIVISYQLYVVPHYHQPPIPVPVKLPTVGQVVTMVTDAYGRATAHLTHLYNILLNTSHLTAVATVHTNSTSLSNLGFQASLEFTGIQYSIAGSNSTRGPDRTIFTWDISVGSFSAGLLRFTADVIISLVSCGGCSATTYKVPVELALTVDET